METTPESEQKKEYNFLSYCYSTNCDNFSGMKFLNQYFMSAVCTEINRNDDNRVTFKNKLKIRNEKEIDCNNTYIEISQPKSIKLKEKNDCFVIFFDLEYKDSLGELNKILKILANLAKNDLKVYIVNFYVEEKDINKNNKDENIENLLTKFGFNNYELTKVNMNNPDELIKSLNKITLDTLQEKDLITFDELDSNPGVSHSICLIY